MTIVSKKRIVCMHKNVEAIKIHTAEKPKSTPIEKLKSIEKTIYAIATR